MGNKLQVLVLFRRGWVRQPETTVFVIPTLLEGSRFALYCYVAFNLTAFAFYSICSLSLRAF